MGFCTWCGAARSSDADRFCRSCGRPLDPLPEAGAAPVGVPPVDPPTAPPTAPLPPPPAPATTAPATTAPLGPPPDWRPPAPGTPGPARDTTRVVAVIGVVVAIVAAGYLGYRFLWPRGGADSPEEAVEGLVAAATAQDPVAVLDLVSPAEVDGMDEVYEVARERAEEADLVEGDGITDAVSLELSELELDVDELGDGLARVTVVDGHYDASWDPDRLPERLDFLAEETEAESRSGDLEDLFEGSEPTFTTVEIDGRWYVTLLGTFADLAYAEAELEAEYSDYDLAEPDYDLVAEDVEPITGEDPEEVVDNLVEAIDDGDPAQLLANLPEDLGRPLRPYVPVLEQALDEGGWAEGELGLDVSADDLDLETEELDDDRLKVTIERGSFGGTAWEDGYDSDSGYLAVDGDCVAAYDEEGYGDEACLGDGPADIGIDEFFVVLSEADGGYQLDPVATAAEYGRTVLAEIDGDLVDDLVEELASEVGVSSENDVTFD